MARPNQEAIDTFISITGASEAVAAQKLEEHGGDLNEAVNAHFSEGDRSALVNVHEAPVAGQDDFMDIDDPVPVGPRRDPLSLLSEMPDTNPFSPLNPNFGRSIFGSGAEITNRAPFVTHPREVREIPIEVKDSDHPSGHSGHTPTIDDVTGTAHAYGPGIQGTVIIDDEDDDIPIAPTVQAGQESVGPDISSNDGSRDQNFGPTAPRFDEPQGYGNDIEEEMIRAAIEASKREVEESQLNQQIGAPSRFDDTGPQQRSSHLEDPELAHAVSLSLKTAEEEKALRGQEGKVGTSEIGDSMAAEVELGKLAASNGRLEAGNSSIQDETEDVEEEPLVRHRSRRMSPGSLDSAKEDGVTEDSPPSSPGEQELGDHPRNSGSVFPSEWGGISSEEHDEAVMLEAAMFGGIPEGTGFRMPYAPHHFMRPESSYPRPVARPPSPSLTAQRLIREQQDDEYLASLQADREKELKAIEEAEARREEDRLKEEESRRKIEEEQELERQLAAKEATLSQEPASDDENAVTLLVRMPDGSRHGRRFLRTDKLQSLFDFIDIGRRVKPGSYRVVRPFPRRAFSDGESALTLNELGLTSKQEALFLELI